MLGIVTEASRQGNVSPDPLFDDVGGFMKFFFIAVPASHGKSVL